MDGIHSGMCPLWIFRFGKRPESVKDQRLVLPECMPNEHEDGSPVTDADLKPLPDGFVPPRRRQMSEENRKASAERMKTFHENRKAFKE